MKKKLLITVSTFIIAIGNLSLAQYHEFDSDSIIINWDRLNENYPEIEDVPFKSLNDPKVVTVESCENTENIILRTKNNVRVFSSVRSNGNSEGEFYYPSYSYDGFDSKMGLYRITENHWEYTAYKYIHITSFGSDITDGLGLMLISPDNKRFATFYEYMGTYHDGGLIIYSFDDRGEFVKELDMSNLNPDFDIDSELAYGVFKLEWIDNSSFRFTTDEEGSEWHTYRLENGKWVKVKK